jgi:hypothetical protein
MNKLQESGSDSGLKVADTPDAGGEEAVSEATGSNSAESNGATNGHTSPAAEHAATNGKASPAAASTSSRKRSNGRTRKLSPDEMDKEIERVQRANGKLGIADGTDADDGSGEPAGEAESAEAVASDAETAASPAGKGRKRKAKAKAAKSPAAETAAAPAAAVAAVRNQQPGESKEDHHARLLKIGQDAYREVSMQLAEAKGQVKRLKKAADVLLEELAELKEGGPEDLPLIDAAEKRSTSDAQAAGGGKGKGRKGKANAAQRELPLGSASGDKNAWRAVHVDDLNLSIQDCNDLKKKNGITILGEIADFSNANHGRLVKLKGFGKVRAERLQESLDAWWKVHPEMIPSEGQDSAPPSADDAKVKGAKGKSDDKAKAAKRVRPIRVASGMAGKRKPAAKAKKAKPAKAKVKKGPAKKKSAAGR